MAASIWIAGATFNDGSTVSLGQSDLSSSSGQITQESRTLSNLYNHVRTGQSDPPRIVAGIELHTSGSADELWAVLCEGGVERSGNPDTQGNDVVIDIVGSSLRRSLVNEIMALSPRTPGGLRELANVLVTQLSATGRIELADPVAPVDFGREPRQHPLHDLHQDRDLEKKIGRWFKRAFGEELAVDRAAGARIPLHVGRDLELRPGEDVFSQPFLARLRSSPRLRQQGDGMCGVLWVS
jgi:hypothetical protein